jgi:aflatoxin B1 aldehyde reductase
VYGGGTSETFLAKIGAEKQGFKIATKCFPSKRYGSGFLQYDHTQKDIHRAVSDSMKALETQKVDLWYLHAPDRETPLKETLKAVHEEYQQGRFKRFGISNYTADEVEEIMKICKENKFVNPTVYQGLYNVIARAGETELLPVLRKHNISYYTYNPSGGGFFAGHITADMKKEGAASGLEKGSRFDENTNQGKMYRKRYFHDSFFEAVEMIKGVSEKSGIPMLEIALRWNMHHSALSKEHNDHVIVSASSVKHIEENLVNFEKGPLPQDVVDTLDKAWVHVRDSGSAAKYHF